MLDSLARLNRELTLDGEAALAIGIGIHTGPAIVGSIGSPNRLEYTAIGSTVNFASRVESLTKELGAQLLVTDFTRNQLKAGLSFKEYPPQRIRGVDGTSEGLLGRQLSLSGRGLLRRKALTARTTSVPRYENSVQSSRLLRFNGVARSLVIIRECPPR